jgi:hypothetical protein
VLIVTVTNPQGYAIRGIRVFAFRADNRIQPFRLFDAAYTNEQGNVSFNIPTGIGQVAFKTKRPGFGEAQFAGGDTQGDCALYPINNDPTVNEGNTLVLLEM